MPFTPEDMLARAREKFEIAMSYDELVDDCTPERHALIEAIGDDTWNGKRLLAKAIEDLIKAKITAMTGAA